jgi:hypothetical protein
MSILAGDYKQCDPHIALSGDSAVAGRNPSRMIMARTIRAAATMAQGKDHALLLWDLAAFFETVEPQEVQATINPDREQAKLPIVATTVAIFGHSMSRVFTYNGQFSRKVVPCISLATGDQSSTSLARGVLIEPISAANSAAHFSVQQCEQQTDYDNLNHVDDYSQEAGGDTDDIFGVLSCAGHVFCLKAQAARFRISEKSVVVSTSLQLGLALQAFFKQQCQVKIQVRNSSEHLGHNRTGGASLYGKLNARFAKAKLRNKRVGTLANHTWRAQNLCKGGTALMATFSSNTLGLPTHLQKQLDSMASNACGASGARPCSTTLVWLRFGYVPSVSTLLSFVKEFIIVAVGFSPRDMSNLEVAWRLEVAHTYDHSDPWKHVGHTIAAVIATVRQAGWEPSAPLQWRDGLHQRNCSTEPLAFAKLLDDFRDSLMQTAWNKAATRPDGDGLEQGKPCFDAVAKARALCVRSGRKDIARMVDRIAAGGATVGSKFDLNVNCVMCGCSHDSTRHRSYGCQQICNYTGSDEFISSWLCKTHWLTRASKRHSFSPGCLWMRGIIPYNWAYGMNSTTSDDQLFQVTTASGASVNDIYSDGASQPKSVPGPSFCSRVGTAAVGIQWGHDDQPLGIQAVLSAVPGSQIIPRAETYGATIGTVLPAAKSEATYRVDASYVMHGSQQINNTHGSLTPAVMRGRNNDLWSAFELAHAGDATNVCKVKAHTTIQQVAEGKVSFRDYAGNAIADCCAKASAQLAAVPEVVRRFASWHHSIAFCAVMRAAIAEHIAEGFRAQKESWDILKSSGMLTAKYFSQAQCNLVKESGHHIVINASGNHSYTDCGIVKRPSSWMFWIKAPCKGGAAWTSPQPKVNVQQVTPSNVLTLHNHRVVPKGAAWFCVNCMQVGQLNAFQDGECSAACGPSHDTRKVSVHHGNFKDFLKAKKAEGKRQKLVHSENQSRAKVTAGLLAASVAPPCNKTPANLSAAPPWKTKVHSSHDAFHVGGYIFCKRCGSVAAFPASRSALFKTCAAATSTEWRLPEGSKYRLTKLSGGLHPELNTTRGAVWPDGRVSSMVLYVHQLHTLEPAVAADTNSEVRDDSTSDEDGTVLTAQWPAYAPPVPLMWSLRSFLLREAADAVHSDREFNIQIHLHCI